MISFTVRMAFEESDRAAVTEMLRHLGPASRQETGCINYIAHFVEGESATVLIYEQYATRRRWSFIAAHRTSINTPQDSTRSCGRGRSRT